MNIEKFWVIIKKLSKTNSPAKRDKLLYDHCNCDSAIREFVAVYDSYYEILHQKFLNTWSYHDSNGIIDMAEDTYYMFITYLLTLGISSIKKLYNSSDEELIPYLISFKYYPNLHTYMDELRLKNYKFHGADSYKIYELTEEIKQEIKKSLNY